MSCIIDAGRLILGRQLDLTLGARGEEDELIGAELCSGRLAERMGSELPGALLRHSHVSVVWRREEGRASRRPQEVDAKLDLAQNVASLRQAEHTGIELKAAFICPVIDGHVELALTDLRDPHVTKGPAPPIVSLADKLP